VTVDDIKGVVDVERHRRGWGIIVGAIEINHDSPSSGRDRVTKDVRPTRNGRLREQIGSRVGQPPSGELECRIGIQIVSDVPPSKAAVIFLRSTAGNENGNKLSSVMSERSGNLQPGGSCNIGAMAQMVCVILRPAGPIG
jgi:hypothetical protein